MNKENSKKNKKNIFLLRPKLVEEKKKNYTNTVTIKNT